MLNPAWPLVSSDAPRGASWKVRAAAPCGRVVADRIEGPMHPPATQRPAVDGDGAVFALLGGALPPRLALSPADYNELAGATPRCEAFGEFREADSFPRQALHHAGQSMKNRSSSTGAKGQFSSARVSASNDSRDGSPIGLAVSDPADSVHFNAA